MRNKAELVTMRKDRFQYVSTWSVILIEQHNQLNDEIKSILTFLLKPTYDPVQLDAKIKFLIKGVKIHLELENTFLSPVLKEVDLTSQQVGMLNDGYQSLQESCEDTINLVRTFILFPTKSELESTHTQQLKEFLDNIKTRLQEEDLIYSSLKKVGLSDVRN